MHDVIIIGSGPAGLTAAIYAARADLDTLLIGGVVHGGQLMNTTMVENFPGFADGIMGPELMIAMEKQAENQGTQTLWKNVTNVDFKSDIKKVYVGDEEYKAKAVIIAVGSSPRKLDIPGEEEFWGHGVSSCATCDGAFYRDKVVAVVGGGDSAMEEATFLTKFAKKVYVIHRRDELRASAVMAERAKSNDKIEFIWNTEVKEIKGEDDIVKSIDLYNNSDESTSELDVDGFFLAIGHIPNSDFLVNEVGMDEQGFIKVEKHTHTDKTGVFVAGDVHDHEYQQAVTAAGMGCRAAMDCEKWLASHG